MAGKDASEDKRSVRFERHRPELTLLYRLVEQYYPDFEAQWASEGRALPDYVRQEFDEYLKCGRLEHGFLRVQCETCHAEHLVAFGCKRREFCPSCGARRMAESAALLVDEVLPRKPMRQWVLSVPFPLRFLFASQPKIMGKALGIVYRTIATHLTHKAGYTNATAHTGAVTLIQRFGSALNLNIHCLTNVMRMMPRQALPETWPDSRCTPECRPRPTNVTSWSGCAATLPYREVGYLDA